MSTEQSDAYMVSDMRNMMQARKGRMMEHNLSDGQFDSMKERHIGNALAAFDKDQANGSGEQV
jgi:gluconate kinase